jgi:hypothetical protein
LKYSRIQLALVLICAAALSAAATLYVSRSGWTLYYGDAEAHLNIARRIVDSRTPGRDQIGTVWLPLPHLLMLPLVARDDLWRNGMAGAVPVSACFVAAALFLFAAARRAFQSSSAAFASLALFAANPNLLYLQATPMTEVVFFAGLMATLYFTVLFRSNQSLAVVAGAGVASFAASLARYEGWFLIPFIALYFLFAAKRRKIALAFLFLAIASLGPISWLAHNWWYYGNPLEFYNGAYSAKAIYERALHQRMAPYPGDHDWAKAWLYFRTAAQLCSGWVAIGAGLLGLGAIVWKRVWWPVVLLLLPPLFYVWSMHSSATPIFVPTLWPNTYYNTRYGLAALPLLAFAAGAVVLFAPGKLRPVAALTMFAAAVFPWAADRRPDTWVCWKESEVNSESRRAWIHEAADIFREKYRQGSGVFTGSGDLTAVFREAGIPLRETLNDGNEPAWMAATQRPELFLREQWALTFSGDAVAKAVQRSPFKSGPHYRLVKAIIVKNAPVVEIYKRNDPPRSPPDHSQQTNAQPQDEPDDEN